MGKAPKAMPVVIYDSNEQKPFLFKTVDPQPGGVIKKHLKVGDYSLEGFEDVLTVERKSWSDFFSSLGSDREREEKKAAKMVDYQFAAYVIEVDWRTMFEEKLIVRRPEPDDPGYSKMNPTSILGTCIAWQRRFGVHFWACPGRDFAEMVTWKILYQFWRDFTKREKHKA